MQLQTTNCSGGLNSFFEIALVTSAAISAEIVTDKPKIVEELVEIYLSGEKNSVKIPISANVVTRQIAILDNSNHPINVADFGNIYVQECFKDI